MKYIAYCRKSREEKDKQILSISAQIAELKEYAKKEHLEITEFVEEEKKVNTIHEDIKNIKENHLAHIQVDMATVRANQEWLMKFFWIIATSAIGGLVVGLFNLMK